LLVGHFFLRLGARILKVETGGIKNLIKQAPPVDYPQQEFLSTKIISWDDVQRPTPASNCQLPMAKQSHSAIHITFKPTDGIGKQVKCVYRPAADGSGTLIVDETRILFNKLVIAPLVEKNGYSGPITKILFEYSLFGPDEEDME